MNLNEVKGLFGMYYIGGMHYSQPMHRHLVSYVFWSLEGRLKTILEVDVKINVSLEVAKELKEELE